MAVKVVIAGAGFAGINVAKGLRRAPNIDVTVIDRSNHHLFQPLLYQVAMAGLSPADIATPIRCLLAGAPNIQVLQAEIQYVDAHRNIVVTDFGELSFDFLILACGRTFAISTPNQRASTCWKPDRESC